jgi:tyrosine-protein kinase Etk/Wzc
MDHVVTVAPLWDRVKARRRGIAVLVASATIVVTVISFLLPAWYRAEAELLPPSQDETGVGLSSMLRGVGVPGVKIPTEVSPADVFLVVLGSRRINEQIVQRFNLKALYKKKLMDDALKELRGHTRFKLTGGGSIQISVEDRNRQRAANMANAYVELLDRFNRETRMTKGRRARLFIESRLEENKQELKSAEERLAQYQTRNKTVALTTEMSSAVREASELYARKAAVQVRLGVIRNFSSGSEEEIQLVQELNQLERQMRALPETGLELARLVRDVKALEQVYGLLTAQYEDARIDEARDVVTVESLDVATPPERKARPRRGLMIAAAFIMSLVVGVTYAALQEEEQRRPIMRTVAAD